MIIETTGHWQLTCSCPLIERVPRQKKKAPQKESTNEPGFEWGKVTFNLSFSGALAANFSVLVSFKNEKVGEALRVK